MIAKVWDEIICDFLVVIKNPVTLIFEDSLL